jgi:hypothetical protein
MSHNTWNRLPADQNPTHILPTPGQELSPVWLRFTVLLRLRLLCPFFHREKPGLVDFGIGACLGCSGRL